MIEIDIIDIVIEKMKNCFHNESEHFSITRDVFTARLQSYILESKKYLEAVEMAFTKQISGRTPEQRGNGLKFVSETVRQNQWRLFFQSGNGTCSIDKNGLSFLESNVSLPGCLAIICFNDR
jgi:hypothetical protein